MALAPVGERLLGAFTSDEGSRANSVYALSGSHCMKHSGAEDDEVASIGMDP